MPKVVQAPKADPFPLRTGELATVAGGVKPWRIVYFNEDEARLTDADNNWSWATRSQLHRYHGTQTVPTKEDQCHE